MKDNPSKPPEQATDTPKAIDAPARVMPGRKIDASTIAQMARLVAKMLTESEACRRLGVKPRTWFDWKSRAGRNQKFADLLEAYRADRIESLIDRIEKSANGIDVKYPDFRAALALLKITDQRRFGDSPAVEIHNHPTATLIACGGDSGLDRIGQEAAKLAEQLRASQTKGELPPPAGLKQLPDAKPAAENEHEK
jgi:hypothetical protein